MLIAVTLKDNQLLRIFGEWVNPAHITNFDDGNKRGHTTIYFIGEGMTHIPDKTIDEVVEEIHRLMYLGESQPKE